MLTLKFPLAKTELTNTQKELIDAFLRDNVMRSQAIIVTGHACNTPVITPETIKAYGDNQGLSEARAQAVRAHLLTTGVHPSRIVSRGRGDTAPVSPERDLNRRVDIELGD